MQNKRFQRPGHTAPQGYDHSKYKKPSVACDVVIVTFSDERLKVVLIQRRHDPYKGYWALPGGFVEIDEPLEVAARRELCEETGLKRVSLIPVGMFGDPERDPRARVISAAYMALVRPHRARPRAGDDARDAGLFPLRRPPELAFDHPKILAAARARLRELALLTPRMFDLLPGVFSRESFLALCQEVMGKRYEPRAFFRDMARVPCLSRQGESGEKSGLYRLDRPGFQTGDFIFLARRTR